MVRQGKSGGDLEYRGNAEITPARHCALILAGLSLA